MCVYNDRKWNRGRLLVFAMPCFALVQGPSLCSPTVVSEKASGCIVQWPCQDASLDTAVGISFTVLASKLYYTVGKKQVQIANDPLSNISSTAASYVQSS